MNPERYQRLCELFEQAQRQAPAKRAAFLDAACLYDPALRAEVEKLLAHDQRAHHEELFQEPCPLNAKVFLGVAELTTGWTVPRGEEPADDPESRERPPATRAIRIRCPHCHNPIQLIDERPEEVLCPSCGSSFRVLEARQTTHRAVAAAGQVSAPGAGGSRGVRCGLACPRYGAGPYRGPQDPACQPVEVGG
jgi:hypothetical protein